MAITFTPKVGEVLECHFGNFPKDHNNNIDHSKVTVDGRMPPEMVKNRLVVVLNGRINNCCVVVPISALKDQDKITRGWHVPIDPTLIDGTPHFQAKDSWAKAEHLQQVSTKRLSKVQGGKSQYLPNDVVTQVQRAVAKVIGASSLLVPAQPPVPAAAPALPAATSAVVVPVETKA